MALAWEPTEDTHPQAWEPWQETYSTLGLGSLERNPQPGFGTCTKETARGWPCTAIGRDP